MRYAIVESGGKQYRAVEGTTIDVDRLALDPGKTLHLERVLLMGDGDTVLVGTPAVGGIEVAATVVDHIKGPKVVSFRYRPKKRIRVKGGHRHQYTRLMIDFIGKPGEERKVEKPAKAPKAEKPAKAPKAPKAAAEKAPAPKAARKPAASRPAARKTDAKKK